LYKITSVVLASSILLNASSNYTLVFTSTKSLDYAKTFIKKHFKNSEQNVYIYKYKDRYRVTYGSFNNKKEFNNFKKNLPWKLKKLDRFQIKANSNDIVYTKYTSKPTKAKEIKAKIQEVKKVEVKQPVKYVQRSVVFNDNSMNNYTYVFANMKTIKRAKMFAHKYLSNNKEDIYIIKHKKGYRVAYGAFASKSQANYFVRNLPKNVRNLDKFLVKNSFDLKSDTIRVVDVIQAAKNKVVSNNSVLKVYEPKVVMEVEPDKPVVKKEIVKEEPKVEIKKTQPIQFSSSDNEIIQKLLFNDIVVPEIKPTKVVLNDEQPKPTKAETTLRAMSEPAPLEPETIEEIIKIKKPKPKKAKTIDEPIDKIKKALDVKANKKVIKQDPHHYTYVFSNLKNTKNARLFIARYLKNNKDDVFVIKHKNRYRVSYGAFKNKTEARKFKSKLPYSLKKLDKFLVRYPFDLKTDYTDVVLKMIPMGTLMAPEVIKEEVPTEPVKNEAIAKADDKAINRKEPQEEKKKDSSKENKNDKKPKDDDKIKAEPKAIREEKSKIKFAVDLQYTPLIVDNTFTYLAGGTKVDTQGDLKLDEASTTIIPTFYLDYGKHQLFATYFGVDQSSTTTLANTLVFSGNTYNAGDSVSAKYTTDWYISGYRYMYNKNTKFGLDIHNYSNTFTLGPGHVKKEFIFPALSIDMTHDINERYSLQYGGSYGLQLGDLSYLNYYLGAGINNLWIDNSNISLGYNSKNLSIEDNGYDGDSEYKGLFLKFKKEF